ncbi:rubrerythrin [Geomonas silvestris]|uniref:Rubrerythrin n=1 Tax=Geomonas silvestris TaxID=2740184 RepID=A0A6V8MP79_9BACT|nr:rubrerythrin family protein [Geomonas silvestris]GFO61744.1 rubrerythrin [Geomonas silvestris]
MATKENLAGAFAGESQANRKYLAFAKQAEKDGYPQVAKLFRAAAHAETVHAHAHLRAMGGINNTLENLKAAVAGEGFEFETMYPPYLAEAQQEGNKPAEISFRNALAVEKVHYDLYNAALESVQGGSDLAARPVYVCEVCGHTVYDQAQDKCEVCGAVKDRFTLID